MYLVKVEKIVTESYIMHLDETGKPHDEDSAREHALRYAMLGEVKHVAAIHARVGNSRKVKCILGSIVVPLEEG